MSKYLPVFIGIGVFTTLLFITTTAVAGNSFFRFSPTAMHRDFLSPDENYHAITFEPNEETVLTLIKDKNGNEIVSPQEGSFVAWSPDSKKVLLFLSLKQNPKGAIVYSIDLEGNHQDLELPLDTIGADISPKDGTIVFSKTDKEGNFSISKRDIDGKDRILVKEVEKILTWVRWSPDGTKILYMESDLLAQANKQSVWIMDADGKDKKQISEVSWNYPAVWSPSGTKIAFAHAGDIWEYDLNTEELNNITNSISDENYFEHPEYTDNGSNVKYIAKTETGYKDFVIESDEDTPANSSDEGQSTSTASSTESETNTNLTNEHE